MARDAHAKAPRTASVLGPVLAFAGLLAACHAAPPAPLLAPIDPSRGYGYSEIDGGPDQVAVSYIGQRHRLAPFAPRTSDATTEAARTEAIDLAIWRAAMIAQARGFAGFHVVDQKVEVDSRLEPASGSPLTDPAPYWRPNVGIVYGAPGYTAALPPARAVQVHATVTVRLVQALGPDDQDAAAAIARLRRAHPDAEGPPAGTSPPPR